MKLPIHLDRHRAMIVLAAAALLLASALPVAATGDLILGSVALSRSGSIDGPSAQADCTAQCQDGSTVTCSGNTCSAVDYSCTTEERGYCDGSSSGAKYCPELDLDQCPVTCTAQTTCPDGTYLYCEGHTGTFACRGGSSLCYVQCDGSYLWCPGHFGEKRCS